VSSGKTNESEKKQNKTNKKQNKFDKKKFDINEGERYLRLSPASPLTVPTTSI
jgi:hypothetical protein